jgi:DNA (cytosine-5)-methyltransferase 1
MCHPTELRALTVGEMAAVQEFPRDWKFSGSPTDKCRQIGNAVPPRLGQVAGHALMALLEKADSKIIVPTVKPSPSRTIHLRPHVRTRSYFKGGEVKHGHVCYYDSGAEDESQLCLSLRERVAIR